MSFQAYLQRQYRKHGAVSPHDRLRVVEDLLERARSQGIFPISETAVGKVDPSHPAVRALLTATKTTESSHANPPGPKMDKLRLPSREDMANWSTSQKVAFLGGVVLAILLVTFGMVALRRAYRARKATSIRPTPSLQPSPTIPTAMSSPTTAPPTPFPTIPPTALPTQTAPQGGGSPPPLQTPEVGTPATDPAAPVAVEIEGYPNPIPVYLADIDKNGLWHLPPNGAQWLPESYIRKVFAIGPDIATHLHFRTGATVRVRTRGGYVETYTLARRFQVANTQIEVMYGQRPSVLILLASTGETREAWLAELPDTLAYAHHAQSTIPQSQASAPPLRAIVTVEGARLRAAPSIRARVERVLPSGLVLELDSETGPIQAGKYTWYRVQAPYPGWIAHTVIQILLTTNP